MERKWLLVVLAALAAGAAGWIVYLKLRPTDEELIRRLFSTAEEAVDQESLRRIMSVVSRDYLDSAGYAWEDVREMAREAFATTYDYQVVTNNLHIQVLSKTRAAATADVTVLIFTKDGLRYGRVRGPMEYGLAKEDGRWRVVSTAGMENPEIELFRPERRPSPSWGEVRSTPEKPRMEPQG